MSMSFISYLINGLSLGSVYAIIALGYTMVYGIAKMLNFAHGDVIMIGAYTALIAISQTGLSPVIGVLIAVVVCTVLGVVIEGVAYRPLRNASSSLAVLITAIGVSYLLQNIALLIFGPNAQTFPSVIKWDGVSLAGGKLNISGETIVTIGACILIMIVLMTFVQKSKQGQAMRAVSEDRGAAQLMGINVNGTIALTFAIGSALAAIAGVLLCSGHQSLCRSCIRRDRFHTGRIYRRPASGSDRDSGQSVYFFPDGRCNCICRSDCCASGEAYGTLREKDSGESVGGRHGKNKEKNKQTDKKQYNNLWNCYSGLYYCPDND